MTAPTRTCTLRSLPSSRTKSSPMGWQSSKALLISVIVLIAANFIGKAVATREDRDWLPTMIMWAAIAKLIGGFGRYWMVTVLYQTGDSYSYHMWGEIFAQVWRGMQVPVSSSGQPGTAFTEVVTGFIYAPYTPSMLGGFIIFSTIAFVGCSCSSWRAGTGWPAISSRCTAWPCSSPRA